MYQCLRHARYAVNLHDLVMVVLVEVCVCAGVASFVHDIHMTLSRERYDYACQDCLEIPHILCVLPGQQYHPTRADCGCFVIQQATELHRQWYPGPGQCCKYSWLLHSRCLTDLKHLDGDLHVMSSACACSKLLLV